MAVPAVLALAKSPNGSVEDLGADAAALGAEAGFAALVAAAAGNAPSVAVAVPTVPDAVGLAAFFP